MNDMDIRVGSAVAPTRAARLESILGDPYDPANPCGHEAILAADDRRELPAEAVAVLDRFGFNAELVPASLGGRLTGIDRLVTTLRPVFRRDPALGLGYGVTNFIAAVNVWRSGSPEQQRELAAELLDGATVSVAYHELAHGNDLMHNEFRADAGAAGYLLHGVKQVINNADRADRAVVFARTDPKPGARSHSLFLVDTGVAAPTLGRMSRLRTTGMRGCRLSGFTFDAHPVSTTAMIGAPGTAAETALCSFQVTRCVTAGLGIGGVDCVLAAVLAFAHRRKLYGVTVAELPHARGVLADAFADLLLCDAYATTAARLLHLAPLHGSRHSAAVKYLVPLILEDAARALSVVLGARGYLRTGEFAIVGKQLRDLPVLSIGHAGGIACLLTILPQLTQLGRTGVGAEVVPAQAFSADELPELDFGTLRLLGRGPDPLIGSLDTQLTELAITADAPTRALAERLRADLYDLLEQSSALPPGACGVDADPAVFRLAERYALLTAAACAIGAWHAGRLPGTEIHWLRALLARVVDRLGRPAPADSALDDLLVTELVERTRAGRDFTLTGDRVHRPEL